MMNLSPVNPAMSALSKVSTPALKFGFDYNSSAEEINTELKSTTNKADVDKLFALAQQSVQAAAEFYKTKILKLALNAPLPKALVDGLKESQNISSEEMLMQTAQAAAAGLIPAEDAKIWNEPLPSPEELAKNQPLKARLLGLAEQGKQIFKTLLDLEPKTP